MPTTFPGISITKAREILQITDKLIKTVPEVEAVLGKIGRAETATDPAPLSMIETTIVLKDREQWRDGMTPKKLIRELDKTVSVPGLVDAWTYPIRTRIDMLSTGIKTPVGIKVTGYDLHTLEKIAVDIEKLLQNFPGVSSVVADRIQGGTYLNININRSALARFNLKIEDVENHVRAAVGTERLSTILDGLARYPLALRYMRELRDDIPDIKSVLVKTPLGFQIPLSQLVDFELVEGPLVIKSEDAKRSAFVYVDLLTEDVGGWVKKAKEYVEKNLQLPVGYSIKWSGQYEMIERVAESLKIIIPATLIIIIAILVFHFHSLAKTLMVLLAIPFALIGSVWLLYILEFNYSTAVMVGFIALAGLAAETGIIMVLYLDTSYKEFEQKGKKYQKELLEAILHGAAGRIRPKTMTVLTVIVSLLPIFFETGIGSDVMKRIAAPMLGGAITSYIGELIVIPILFYLWKLKEVEK